MTSAKKLGAVTLFVVSLSGLPAIANASPAFPYQTQSAHTAALTSQSPATATRGAQGDKTSSAAGDKTSSARQLAIAPAPQHVTVDPPVRSNCVSGPSEVFTPIDGAGLACPQ